MKSPTHISRAASFRRLRLTLLLVAMVMMASGVSAQVRRQIPRPIQKPIKNKNDRQPRGPAAPPVLISVSASIENLLRKADEGIDRRQWKLTIDSLQRVIESPERSLVPADDDGRFESIRNVALRKLSTLPPEAMSAYHLLYDGKARAMFDRARQGHDIDLLQSVVDRYLLTAVGGEASSLLAGWLLDEGKAADALRIVEDLEQFGGVSGLPARSLVKKAAALALTGRSDDARAVFDRISDDDQDLSGDGLSGDSDAFLASLSVALRWRQSRLVQSDNPDGWPVVAGDNARRSLMPPVNPTVSGGIPWRFVLGGTTDFEWRPLVTDDPMGPLVQPPGNIVIDGDLLFLRTPSRLVALDAATLQQVWSRPFPAREYRVDPTNQPRQVGQVSRIAYDRDFAAWAVAAHDGKVFVLQRHMQRSDGIRRSSIQNYRHFPAWLCAFEQSTGRRLWQVGRLEEFPHPLADVEIRSAPIWAEGQLWFTYQRQRDLYLASVRASDGQINRSILLCSLPSPATPSWLPLDPAYDDGTVYVPTGEGMLLAVRTRDGNLLWATKYGESVTPTNAPPPIRPASRLVSAPVIADGLVLLAPTERNELFAFTADGGDIQWRVPLEGASYIVGATDSEVYLGGRTLCSLSLLDGSQKWSRPVEGAPTARTVLSGPHLLTPTWEEFVVTRAADGEVLSSQVLPSGQPPLGRLLCIKNAMYSVDPNLVRKFPDVERAYPETLARFEAAPDDANLATRLAWMELLKKSPERAYRVVRDFKVPDGVDPEARVALDRVRVSSLMSMADGADPTDRGALSWLEEAERYASTAQERVRVQLAFADRLRSLGDVTDAYQKLVQLGTAPDSRDVALRDGLTSYAVRLDVSSRLASLETVLREDQRQGLIDLLDARFATLSGKLRDNNDSQQAVAELDGLIHLDLLGETTIDALFELADLRMDQQRFEQAEQLLREALRRAETDQTRIRCLLRLYESVAGVSEFPGPAHEKSLSYLTSTYGKASIEDLGDMIVEDWVASERDRIKDLYGLNDSQRTALGPGFDGSVAWSPIQSRRSVRRVGRTTTANRPWTGTANTDGVILFSGPEDAVLDDRVVLINEEDTVQCIHAGNGAVLWESQLGFPSIEEAEPIVELQSVNDAGLPVTAVVDGQTAVIRGASGLHALGLVSGKR
ncbi:MAG: PQQ-binding-like beta-propeller repeat protein, partial [Phycisphaerae bacterium]